MAQMAGLTYTERNENDGPIFDVNINSIPDATANKNVGSGKNK